MLSTREPRPILAYSLLFQTAPSYTYCKFWLVVDLVAKKVIPHVYIVWSAYGYYRGMWPCACYVLHANSTSSYRDMDDVRHFLYDL